MVFTLRRTRAIDYIKKLMSSGDEDGAKAGEDLFELYLKWKETLELNDFLTFVDLIQNRWKDTIMRVLKGMPQMIGQFRAFSFEEYLVDVIRSKLKPERRGFRILWNEKLLIWRGGGREYRAALDIVLSRAEGYGEVPVVAIEAKIDVDAPRLRAVMLNFEMLRKVYPEVKTALVYLYWNADEILKDIARMFIDELFNFTSKRHVPAFLEFVNSALSKEI